MITACPAKAVASRLFQISDVCGSRLASFKARHHLTPVTPALSVSFRPLHLRCFGHSRITDRRATVHTACFEFLDARGGLLSNSISQCTRKSIC